MVVSCMAPSYAEAQKIRKALVAITGCMPSNVFEEKIAEDAFVLSVRVETASEVQQTEQALQKLGANDISDFSEAA